MLTDLEEVRSVVRRVVAEAPDTVAECRYVDADGAPMCIVGHVLSALEPDVFKIIVGDKALNSYTIDIISAALDELEMSRKVLRYLKALQALQDEGYPWSWVLALAEEECGGV